MPQKFVGAPSLPAVFSMLFSLFTFMLLIFMELDINVLIITVGFLVSLLCGHFAIMSMGSREPHLTSLIQSIRHSSRKPRILGARAKRAFEP